MKLKFNRKVAEKIAGLFLARLKNLITWQEMLDNVELELILA